MPSFNFGFELNTPIVVGQGCVAALAIQAPMVLTGIQIDCAIMSLNATQAEWSEVLFNVAHMTATQWANWLAPGDVHAYINTAPDPHVASAALGFAGVPLIGGAGMSNFLCSMIIKQWGPTGTGRGLYVPLNMLVSVGDGIFFHMDQDGAAVDAEMQGVIFYEEALLT